MTKKLNTYQILLIICLASMAGGILFMACNDPLSGSPSMDGDNGKSEYCADACDDISKCGFHTGMGYNSLSDCKGDCGNLIKLYPCFIAVNSCDQLSLCLQEEYGGTGDDDFSTCEYSSEFEWLYNFCDIQYYDGSSAESSLEKALLICDSCHGECAGKYMDTNNCNKAQTCLAENCW